MSISNRKVVIVGAGHVGSHVGDALISQSLADEIANRNAAASISTQNSASHAVSPALPGQSTRRAARNTS